MTTTFEFNEKTSVEDYLVKKLCENGWTYIPSDELVRESFEEPLIINDLIHAIKKLNLDSGISEEDIKQVINEIKLKAPGRQSGKEILNYLKFGIPIKFEKDKVLRYVNLIDYSNIINNKSVISRQVIYQGTEHAPRMDIVLYVNGIPLVIIECKSSVSFSVDWTDAYDDIKEYEYLVPELFKYLQIGVAAEHIAKYFPIVPGSNQVEINEWKIEGNDSIDSIIDMLKPTTLLDIIRNFLFFRTQKGNQTKIICRYIQYRAANKIVNRVLNYIHTDNTKNVKNKGLVWHWQGSGKTLSMIFAANKLFNHPLLENPSIFFIVDRVGLEDQLFDEMTSLDVISPEPITSVNELRNIIRHDDYSGKRGMMITLIHKFRNVELNQLIMELEVAESNGKNTIMNRKNVIAFIDEGHRSQYGMLAAEMKNLLRKATFFAFTGTPISKKGKDTYLEFSYPPSETYLDKYFISDSIKDGFTLKLVYQPRLEEDVYLKKYLLETFLEIEDDELPEDIRHIVKENVKNDLKTIKVILENENRIRMICKDIAEHFAENVDNKFKAMIVAASRDACVIYKRELDKVLPPQYSEVVMTYGQESSTLVKEYFLSLTERIHMSNPNDINKKIRDDFKERDSPKILIVTDMLLHGFDAPILQTMYLDKPLKEHKLLQAIARTNRPFKDMKEAGLIIDYIGILSNFRKAFQLYIGNDELFDEEEVNMILSDMNQMRNEFSKLIGLTLDLFSNVPKNKYDRETLLDAVRAITSDKENLKLFLSNFKSLRRKFELLGSDLIKSELVSSYKWLLAVYTYYIIEIEGRKTEKEREQAMYTERYLSKTIKLAHKSTEINEIRKNLPKIEFDRDYLKNLEDRIEVKKEKVANMVFTLNKYVLVDKDINPIFEGIVDKVERLIKKWQKKNVDFEELYKDGHSIIEEINERYNRQSELNLSDYEYAVLLTLEEKWKGKELINDVRRLINDLTANGYLFPGCFDQRTVKKEIERSIRKFLRRTYVARYNIDLSDIDQLTIKIINKLKHYTEN
jgi:type I restriction enzyme, R subunit